MQASCLFYDPLRDLAKEEEEKNKKGEKNYNLPKSVCTKNTHNLNKLTQGLKEFNSA